MPVQGYIRYPHIFQDQIVFVTEDDLWVVRDDGGRAERWTAGVGEVSHPRFSPDGKFLAFVGREEGPSEVYVMPATGESARRLTFQGATCRVLGWSPDGREILYASNAGQFTPRFQTIFAISPEGGLPRALSYGMANATSYGSQGGVVLGRNIREPAYWKRYRGGTVGHLWCDVEGDGTFKRLLALDGNLADPCWVGERIYFLSDHEGVGNIYSCTPAGEDLRRHTTHHDFYARSLASDGQRLVYHAGADLYLFDPQTEETRQVSVQMPSMRTQRNRKFATASHYLDTYALHPQGYAAAFTTRGKAFTMGNWEGSVLQHGEPDGVRYRFLEWLNDGQRLVAVSDATGEERLVIFNPEDASEPRVLAEAEFGRAVNLAVSPTDDVVAITNHRQELLVVDLETGSLRVLDRSEYARIAGISWSPDGKWLAYGFAISGQKTAIKLCELESGATHQVTDPILEDVSPAFDPEGKFLYFIGARHFTPQHDSHQFEYSFPRGSKPYAIMLKRDQRSPFIPEPKAPGEKESSANAKSEENGSTPDGKAQENGTLNEKSNGEKAKEGEEKKPITIDLEGIRERVLPFPVGEGRYTAIRGIKGKALFSSWPMENTIPDEPDHAHPKGIIESYDFENYKTEKILEGVGGFDLSRDAKTLIYRSHHRMRVVKAGEKPKTENGASNRETGWLDLNRIKVSVLPAAEWRQMFAEAWRLQREQFWNEDMSGIDWQAVYEQYAPLVERVSSRSELSDLFWELQGELGTSHSYEMGGEYRKAPHYHQGFLGVDWSYDAEKQRYLITRIVKGDTANNHETSPLTLPGLEVAVGDAVLAINGQRVSSERTPQELLVNQARHEVQLTIEDAETQEIRTVTVKTLRSEYPARYREWVEENRRRVHELSDGKVGYIHIPDMGTHGFSEFHRSFLAEYDAPGLLVDVRWNGGGNVSGLLLEKLARRRIGYDFQRWGQPDPYPQTSPRGPMVALTNEHAGSDGDIFSHSFKLMGLGPLLGKRTWGGVIGIHPRHRLVDNTVTTQAEFSFWFKDVGWNVENYGTDPDIEVDIAPQDFARQEDPQLERAVSEVLRVIDEFETLEPQPGERPRLSRSLQL
ncbi:tricorn protease [Ktedonobacter sp. SOSP1-85]|uniref:S41 family peptidase n=1 Tax=Ktedonobacter sp. SOSP1-85 TaxID=2778367 RepID=UPI001916C65C|nr:S41 family peptidase [Ktedonobacter sp. SOSP1-85]GHO74059.1 tricorn protease [Ktedonobacter sp. SOSP1-85]